MEERAVSNRGDWTAETPQLTLCMSWLFTAQGDHGCAASRGSMVSLHAGSRGLALTSGLCNVDFILCGSSLGDDS